MTNETYGDPARTFGRRPSKFTWADRRDIAATCLLFVLSFELGGYVAMQLLMPAVLR